jgi:hypothetical protein
VLPFTVDPLYARQHVLARKIRDFCSEQARMKMAGGWVEGGLGSLIVCVCHCVVMNK